MSADRWFAPGKVVLAGEYAVLDGAPALVAAVDLGVAVTHRPAADGAVHTRSDVGDTRFVDAALEAVRAPAGHWDFTTAGGPDLASKPGLGGSAAATVVAVHAGLEVSGRPTSRAEVFRTAFDVHHRVQGSGSGVDVAASTWGGVTRFVRETIPHPVDPLPVTVVFSGQSAHTGPRVARYLAWDGRDAFVAETTALVDALHDDPVRHLAEHGRQLAAMAEAAGIAYRTPALDRIVTLAEAHGGAGKPSGAGGGDCAIALVPDPDAREAFAAACAAEGFAVLATDVAPGVGRQAAGPSPEQAFARR